MPRTASGPAAGRRPAGRAGFTLVELLVAAALTVLVMAILATAFQQGMETLSHLKSAVGLSQQLRSVEGVIRREVGAPHLEDATDGTTVRVSDRTRIGPGWRSPNKGYFRVEIPTSMAVNSANFEGTDTDGPSYRATDHRLLFTVRLPGGTPQDVVTANMQGLLELPKQSMKNMVGPGEGNIVFAGVWAEVAYYLEEGPVFTAEEGGQALKLYTLKRRVRALAPEAQPQQKGVNPAAYRELSVGPTGTVNTPADVAASAGFANGTTPATRGNRAAVPGDLRVSRDASGSIPLTDPLAGSDVLLSNVVSMQVQLLLDPTPNSSSDPTTPTPPAPPAGNIDRTYVDEPRRPRLEPDTTAWAFDTFNPPKVLGPAAPDTAERFRLRGVQIRLRVYDVRNRMTRQVSIAQDL